MAALPSPTQVAGSQAAIYEAYYNQVDPNGYGRIGAMEAARFLKKSQLSDVVLSKIWDMADPQSRGSLDKSGLFVALKLCALAQAGMHLNMANISMELPPPKMGEIPVVPQKAPVNALPVITAVSNGDWSIKPSERAKYDQLFDSLQPSNGYIPGNKVKGVLMDSKLPLSTLGKIWDLADMDEDGMLDRHEFVVAMHLVYKALEKYAIPSVLPPELMPPGKRKDVSPKIPSPAPPPIPPLPKGLTNLDKPAVIAQQPQPQQPQQWVVSNEDQAAAEKLFLQADTDMDGYVSGLEIKDVFLQSGLSHTVLAHIWNICDTSHSGKLNKEQFALVMWLIKRKLRGVEPPNALTPDMIPPSMRKETVVPAVIAQQPQQPQQWVVSNEDQAAAEKLFLQTDMDMDGYVSSLEIRDVFLQSGLPHTVLAHIWSLCDTTQSGKLNKEQFALAMWLIKRKLRGVEPPTTLTPDMIPPSMRKETVVESNNVSGYSNPELDMISKDIAELVRERQSMEQDIAQKEADIKIKTGEIKSLQSELDTLATTLKQLENQKGEAQKRLNDLRAQKAEVDKDLSEVELKIREEQNKVEKLRQQAEEQESVLRTQEEELTSKRQELEGLRQEEQQLEQQQTKSREQLNELTKNLQEIQLQICQAKARITHLQEQQRQMTDAIALYETALSSGNPSLVPDTSLQFEPEIEEPQEAQEEEQKKEAEKRTGPEQDGFGEQDPFASSKAKEAFDAATPADPFAAFPAQPATGGFATDPFAAFDNSNPVKQDPFDPFGDGKRNDNKPAAAPTATKDPFGEDPFANLHAPTRPESPSPALPPKKAKQPPPRPAPPRPSQGPRAAPAPAPPTPSPDPFSNPDPFDNNNTSFTTTNANTTGFADFANFDSKPEPTRSRQQHQHQQHHLTTTTSITTTTSNNSNVSSNLGGPPVSNNATIISNKLPDFTEDPFRDYRYEDPFNIADPFAEEDLNANDPFFKHSVQNVM